MNLFSVTKTIYTIILSKIIQTLKPYYIKGLVLIGIPLFFIILHHSFSLFFLLQSNLPSLFFSHRLIKKNAKKENDERLRQNLRKKMKETKPTNDDMNQVSDRGGEKGKEKSGRKVNSKMILSYTSN
jgi:hypothetical protein